VAAHHVDLDEKVALKFLLPSTLHSSDAVARFAREARAAVKIKSEHVAKVTDVGRLENGAPYMVMEYLEGGDLSAWLAQRGALPIEQATEFLLQACEAIAEAHALGIVHRDLKPANLFVIRRPDNTLSVKVLDFGISKLKSLTGSSGDASITQTAAIMGSPLYMSPDQLQSSKTADARSDIWALGVILYELVTGTAPFMAPTMPDKDRGKRFQTVGELAIALLPFAPKRSKASVERISGVLMAAGLAGSAVVLPPSSDATEPVAGASTAASWGRTTTPGERRKVIILAGGGVAAILSGILFFLRPSSATDPRPGTLESATANLVPGSQAVQHSWPALSPAPGAPSAERSPSGGAQVVTPAVDLSALPVDSPAENVKVAATGRGTKATPPPSASGPRPPPTAVPQSTRAPPVPPPAGGPNIFDDRK
jgi:serine/threonine-protein kinase